MSALTIRFNGSAYNRYFIDDKHIVEITPCYKWGHTDGFMVAVSNAENNSDNYQVRITAEIIQKGKKSWGKVDGYEIGISISRADDDTYELEYSEEYIREGGCLLW